VYAYVYVYECVYVYEFEDVHVSVGLRMYVCVRVRRCGKCVCVWEGGEIWYVCVCVLSTECMYEYTYVCVCANGYLDAVCVHAGMCVLYVGLLGSVCV